MFGNYVPKSLKFKKKILVDINSKNLYVVNKMQCSSCVLLNSALIFVYLIIIFESPLIYLFFFLLQVIKMSLPHCPSVLLWKSENGKSTLYKSPLNEITLSIFGIFITKSIPALVIMKSSFE